MCGEVRPFEMFHRSASERDGYRPECKPCRKAYRQRLRGMTPEEKAEPKLRELLSPTRTCTGCGETKSKAEFGPKNGDPTRLLARCKACSREYQQQWRAANIDRLTAQNKAYYEATRDRQAERAREYRARYAEQRAIRRHMRVAFAVEEGEQKCTKCAETKPVTDFYRNGDSANGRDYWCCDCTNSTRRDWYQRNREREMEKSRAWRTANPELVKELCRAWYEANKDRSVAAKRAWREANLGRDKANQRAWREANPEYQRQWAAANREAVRAAARKYQKAHPEVNAEQARRRRALERGLAVGEIDLDALWTGECSLCGNAIDPDLKWPDPLSKSVDHTIPIARGGTHEQSNLTIAHLVCNMRKGARLPDELTG